jgi:enoyl-CoA hydratase/carnithine racemase
MSTYTDIGVEKIGHVGLIEIQRPPLNFFDISLINQIADALEEFDRDIEIRSSVLAAQGKAFCAGANFKDPARQEQEARAQADPASSRGQISHLYVQAVRIFRNQKPIVAAVHGAAIGGGLGLAVSADFRVTCPEARFAANFTKLGFHPGFGLTATLPELVGKNNAELIFYTSRRVTGEEAYRMGLANECVPQNQVRERALKLAQEIAECSPLGLISTRATMRAGLTNLPNRRGCAPPKTSRKASRRPRNGGSPTSRDGKLPTPIQSAAGTFHLKNVRCGGLAMDNCEHACSVLSGTVPRSWGQ